MAQPAFDYTDVLHLQFCGEVEEMGPPGKRGKAKAAHVDDSYINSGVISSDTEGLEGNSSDSSSSDDCCDKGGQVTHLKC